MNFLFPAAFATNTLAMTALLIGFGLAGDSTMAADIGMVQGASLALFYALSANARSLILNPVSPVCADAILLSRLLLLPMVAALTYWLSISVANVPPLLASILILRRGTEWIGEVHLSELERVGDRKAAKAQLLSQALLLLLAMGWYMAQMPFPLLGILLWAFVPLFHNLRFVRGSLSADRDGLANTWTRMVPHFGSSAIIGIGVYVFRLLLLLIAGKHIAGDLFTAFALGGVIGSIFTNAFGPSIILEQQRTGSRTLSRPLRAILIASLTAGTALISSSLLAPGILGWSGKSPLFWGAVGYSLLGGAVMIYAQLIRLWILQNHKDSDLFGPDTIMNILIIISIPLLSNLFGTHILATLFLFNSLLALIFYWSYERGEHLYASWRDRTQNVVLISIAVLILTPLFVQLGSGIFRSPALYYDSHGTLRLLPVPLSAFICYAGIAILGGYQKATASLTFIFFSCVLMIGSAVASTQDLFNQERDKLILLAQFVIPMFGMVLGEIYSGKEKAFATSLEKAFLYILLIIVPLQLASTWLQGNRILSPYLHFFSVYGHLQYVPVIFVSAFLITFSRLWQVPGYKPVLLILSPLMGIYVAASISMAAIALLILSFSGIAFLYYRTFADKRILVVLLAILLATTSYFQYAKHDGTAAMKFAFLSNDKHTDAPLVQGPAPVISVPQHKEVAVDIQKVPNLSERFTFWKYYFDGITSSPEALLWGHAQPPNRTLYPSAHNYYLDLAYNFGSVGLLPLLALIGYLGTAVFRARRELFASPHLLTLAFVVAFLMLVDNSLKVGLRQPYSGIFTYFICGLLAGRLSKLTKSRILKNELAY
jgi:hypothetical protein